MGQEVEQEKEVEQQTETPYVKRDTMLIVAFIALIAGFVAGGLVGQYDFGSKPSAPTSTPPQPAVQPPHPPPPGQQQMMEAGGPSSGRFDKMIAGLEREVSEHPDNAQAWKQLGISYGSMRQYDRGIDAYKKYVELEPNDANIWTNLGVLLSRKGQGTEAIEAFDKAIQIDPKNEGARYNKGLAMMINQRDLEGAFKVWEDLLSLNPSATAPNGQPIKDLIENLKKMHDATQKP